MVDDILDFTQSTEQLGKPQGQDLASGNLTAPAIFALQVGSSPRRGTGLGPARVGWSGLLGPWASGQDLREGMQRTAVCRHTAVVREDRCHAHPALPPAEPRGGAGAAGDH